MPTLDHQPSEVEGQGPLLPTVMFLLNRRIRTRRSNRVVHLFLTDGFVLVVSVHCDLLNAKFLFLALYVLLLINRALTRDHPDDAFTLRSQVAMPQICLCDYSLCTPLLRTDKNNVQCIEESGKVVGSS